jgi:hypothetical protein
MVVQSASAKSKTYLQNNQNKNDWRHGSRVEHLPSKHEA